MGDGNHPPISFLAVILEPIENPYKLALDSGLRWNNT